MLAGALMAAGLTPVIPDGGFFIMADTSGIRVPEAYLAETTPAAPVMTRDWAFCRFLTKEIGVAAIPPSAFYSAEHRCAGAGGGGRGGWGVRRARRQGHTGVICALRVLQDRRYAR